MISIGLSLGDASSAGLKWLAKTAVIDSKLRLKPAQGVFFSSAEVVVELLRERLVKLAGEKPRFGSGQHHWLCRMFRVGQWRVSV